MRSSGTALGYAATLGTSSLLHFVYFFNIAFPFLFTVEGERGLRRYGTLLPIALFGFFHLAYDDTLIDPLLTDAARIVVSASLMPVVLLLLVAALSYMYHENARHEGELRFLAQHDSLTGLANRARFNTEVEKAIARASRGRSYRYALLYLDLDKFKSINDTYGHLVGDRALQHVAEKALTCLRTGDLLARLGGDEFIALLDDIQAAEDAVLAVAADYPAAAYEVPLRTVVGQRRNDIPQARQRVRPGEGDEEHRVGSRSAWPRRRLGAGTPPAARPVVRPAANTPTGQSPAPTVSTASPFAAAAISLVPPAVTMHVPRSPIVSSTLPIPSWRARVWPRSRRQRRPARPQRCRARPTPPARRC